MQPLAGVRFGDSDDGLFAELSLRPALRRLISRRFRAANVRLWEIKLHPLLYVGFVFIARAALRRPVNLVLVTQNNEFGFTA